MSNSFDVSHRKADGPGKNTAPARRRPLALAVSALLLSSGVCAAEFPATIKLSELTGNGALRIDGAAAGHRSGAAVSGIGDFNGDGLDDVIIGARSAGPNGQYSGSSFVVFGRRDSLAAMLDLSSLDGSNGFRVDGTAIADATGASVSAAGDFNGDGIDDLLIGSRSDTRNSSSYLIYGQTTPFASALALDSLNGSNGFRIRGPSYSVSAAGDVNGDGLSDLIIGSNRDNDIGECHVVFGSRSAPALLELSSLDGHNGFRIELGLSADSGYDGMPVSEAGDFNGDGFDDLLVGDPVADPNGRNSGSAYLLFGRQGPFEAVLPLSVLDGSSGFRVDGLTGGTYLGQSLASAGDVNGDGFGDVIIATKGDSFGQPRGGYVIFGRSEPVGANLALTDLDGSNGFLIGGRVLPVNAAGDINGDGIDDILLAYAYAEPNVAFSPSGSTYVVYGQSTPYEAVLPLSALDGSNGFRLDGADRDRIGTSISGVGDSNGDGVDDFIIGAPWSNNGLESSGSSYLVYGRAAGTINYSYTYYNPTEPGWGFNALHQGELLYGTWYTYADDGQVMFLTVEGTLQLDGSFAGPVYRVSGTPLELINGSQAFTSINQVGEASMSFDGAGALALSYTIAGINQIKTLERFVFDQAAPSCRGTTLSRASASNYSDLWWNPSEAGWGLTLAHQGDIIFVLWYTYGEAGRDQWISASTLNKQADGSFSGALQRPESGVPLSQIAGPATTFPVPEFGSASLSFSDGENASFSYTINGVTQSKAITRFVAVGADQAKPICEVVDMPGANRSTASRSRSAIPPRR